MKKSVALASLLLFAVIVFTAFHSKDKHPTDMRDCLEKVKSNWGEKCLGCESNYKDSYKLTLVNICEETLDIKVAVQNTNITWRIFDKESLAPGDTFFAYSCEGTGRFLKWVKKAGDKTISFPSNPEIYKLYPR